jgi:polyhydroxyalkanoate synthesis regulator phasin
MLEYLRKIGLLGIGIAALTKEKAEDIVNEFVEKGELSSEEGKELVKDLLKKSEEQRKDLAKKIDSEVKKALKGLIVSKSDIERLERRIEKLEGTLKRR